MTLCDVEEPIGLRDRALLEVLYSTGMRRLEIVRLKLYDLQLDRGLILVNQGKGSKDRYVPIGARAAAWLEKYMREGRPQLISEPDDFSVFLTAQGEPFSRDHLTFVVRGRIEDAKLGKGGACHLFRHYVPFRTMSSDFAKCRRPLDNARRRANRVDQSPDIVFLHFQDYKLFRNPSSWSPG
jgi:site-specific recombinase XerD